VTNTLAYFTDSYVTKKMKFFEYGPWPQPQTLGKAENACQAQTFGLNLSRRHFLEIKFNEIATRLRDASSSDVSSVMHRLRSRVTSSHFAFTSSFRSVNSVLRRNISSWASLSFDLQSGVKVSNFFLRHIRRTQIS